MSERSSTVRLPDADDTARPQVATHSVFMTGGTGYIGRALVPALLARGHSVRVLTRNQSRARVPGGAGVIIGDALRAQSYASAVAPADTFVHLVGTPRPSPAKAGEFRDIDLVSLQAAAEAASGARVRHFVYLSVAQPAPVMQAYVQVRRQGEALLRASGMNATFVRPWYVLGKGHRWPLLLLPFYGIAQLRASSRETAKRLGLVTLKQMVRALVAVVEEPPDGHRIVDVPRIRALGSAG